MPTIKKQIVSGRKCAIGVVRQNSKWMQIDKWRAFVCLFVCLIAWGNFVLLSTMGCITISWRCFAITWRKSKSIRFPTSNFDGESFSNVLLFILIYWMLIVSFASHMLEATALNNLQSLIVRVCCLRVSFNHILQNKKQRTLISYMAIALSIPYQVKGEKPTAIFEGL